MVEEAHVRIWLAFAASWHKEFNPLLKALSLGRTRIRDDLKLNTAAHVLETRLDQLESRLKGREWVATIADEAPKIKIEMLPGICVQGDSRLNPATPMQRCATVKVALIRDLGKLKYVSRLEMRAQQSWHGTRHPLEQ